MHAYNESLNPPAAITGLFGCSCSAGITGLLSCGHWVVPVDLIMENILYHPRPQAQVGPCELEPGDEDAMYQTLL